MKTKRTFVCGIVAAVLVAVIGFGMAACDSGSDPGSDTSQTPPPPATPAVGDFVISNRTQSVGSVTAVKITPKAGKSGGAITIYYDNSTTLPMEIGAYSVTFDVAAVSNWNAASGLSAGTFTIQEPIDPVAADFDISGTTQTYDGNTKSVVISPKTGKSEGAITIYYSNSKISPVNAGTYAVTFDVEKAGGYNAVTGLPAETLTVSKAVGARVSAPTELSKNYNRITVNALTSLVNGQAVEYAISRASNGSGLSAWQSDTVFTGLNANTAYYVYARSVESNNYNTGTASISAAITTPEIGTAEVVYYWVNEQDMLATTNAGGGTITLSPGQELPITAQGTGYTNQQWYLNGLNTGRTGVTYIFSSMITGKYTVGLFVEKGGKWYNTNFAITVE